MRRPWNKAGLVTAALSVLIVISACSAAQPNVIAAPTTAASPSASVSDPADPTSSLTPTPSASATTVKPHPTGTTGGTASTPSHSPPPPAGPISCTGQATLNRSTAGGTGPLGSLRATGTTDVALTFDDGPDPVNTPKILDLLKQCGVKATFCLVGHRARDNPDLVRRIYSEGHTLCNHSWQHLDLSHPPATTATGKPYTILHDLEATNNAIHTAVPGAPIAYFRAPYGAWTQDVIDAATALHMIPLDWSVDPRDWDSASFGTGTAMSQHVISAVESAVHPGSIVLSHDNVHPDTVVAYRTLLPWLKARFTLIALPPIPAP